MTRRSMMSLASTGPVTCPITRWPSAAKCSTESSDTGSSASRTLRPLPATPRPAKTHGAPLAITRPGSELSALALVTMSPSMRAWATSRS